MFSVKQHLKSNNKLIGYLGENIASRFLLENSYRILMRNLKVGFDEIDIIGEDSFGVIVFFEVKSCKQSEFGFFNPEDHFSWEKRQKMVRACQNLVGRKSIVYFGKTDFEWRMDLIAITFRYSQMRFNLRHYKNV